MVSIFTSEIPYTTKSTNESLSLACFDKVLYVVGKGRHKGTMAIAQAWMQHPEWPTLTLTSFHNAIVDNILANLPKDYHPFIYLV
jgi:hypothetical protein